MGEGWKRAVTAAKRTRQINCPRCHRYICRGADWAPGYPTLRKHNGPDGKVCGVGYLRESKVDGRWVED